MMKRRSDEHTNTVSWFANGLLQPLHVVGEEKDIRVWNESTVLIDIEK